MTTVIPHLTCRNAAEAYEFYQKAFGAAPIGLMKAPDGAVMHASVSIEGAPVYLHDEFPAHGVVGPQTLGGTSVTIHLQVDDCDAVFAQAVAAGCTVSMPLDDMFWGDRFGEVTDPYGHRWSIATTKQHLSHDEAQEAMHEAMSGTR